IVYYALGDFIAASVSWVITYYLFIIYYGASVSYSYRYFLELFIYAAGWLILYHLFGAYKNIYYKSRLNEMWYTFGSTFTGCVLLLFLFIFYEDKIDNTLFYKGFFILLALQFFSTYLFRSLLLSLVHTQLQKQQVWFNTLIIGSNENALRLYKSIADNKEKTGYRICGFVTVENIISPLLSAFTPSLGTINNTQKIIEDYDVKEVIIALEHNEKERLEKILQLLNEKEVNVKMVPDKLDILSGAVITTNVMRTTLIEIHLGLMDVWQQNIKRLIDVLVSISGLIILSPLILYAAVRTKLSSKGKILFLQERVGYKSKPFIIYKFRSMITGAEKNGPLL